MIDAGGRRIGVKRNGVLERGFLYGRGLGPVAELDADGTVQRRFVYATHSNVPDLMVQGATTYRIITDQVGIAAGGRGHEPRRGRRRNSTTTSSATSRATSAPASSRSASPAACTTATPGWCASAPATTTRRLGRFTTPDPLRFGGGGTNLYGYALNDPVNLSDPSGQILDTLLDIGFIAYDLYRHRASR